MPVRKATVEDMPQLLEVDKEVFKDYLLSEAKLKNLIKSHRSEVQVLEIDNTIIGMAAIIYIPSKSIAYLYTIEIMRQYEGYGNGRWLLFTIAFAAKLKGCNQLILDVREDNKHAIKFYQKNGFQQIGTLDNYYEDGTAALRLSKELVQVR